MRRLMLTLISMLLLLLPAEAQTADGPSVLILEIDGPIGPATSDFVSRGIALAPEQDMALVVLQMDTPGGLDSSMRDIIRSISASPVPVATFVAPSGARAASAGAYILISSHVAAMAPGTNVGAATPVQIGGVPDIGGPLQKDSKEPGTEPGEGDGPDSGGRGGDAMERKLINDAVAYIRSLAQMRGRNVEWAERAVRDAESLSAEAALQENVIDLMATDVHDLLARLEGMEVEVLGQSRVLRTEGLASVYLQPDWRNRILAVIADPNVAYVLMLIGIYGLFFELANPGFVLPGVVGAICLILALYAFQVLPVNYAGVALILLGILFMVGEAIVPSFGALGLGGLIAFVVGSIILFRDAGGDYQVALPLVGSLALVSAGFFLGIVGMAIKARKRPVVSGGEELIGAQAEVLEDFGDQGRIRVHGEVWTGETGAPVTRGQMVRVTGRHGLVLRIQTLSEE